MRPRFRAFALIVGVALPACSQPPVEPAVLAAQEFLTAVDNSDCEKASTYLSARARAYVDSKTAEMASETVYGSRPWMPEHFYCVPTHFHDFGMFQADTAALKSRSGPRAVVSVERLEPDPKSFLLPGFWATRYNRFQEGMHMVEESGTWKLVLP